MTLRRGIIAVMCAVFVVQGLVMLRKGEAARGRVIILGFDGVDPRITQEMMDKGELPNLKKLAESGVFTPLASSNPPQSPTAWSNFATCTEPVDHGIFDFLRRNPANYLPGVGFGSAKRPDLLPDGALTESLVYQSHRKGKTFWKVANEQGLKVKALVVPFAYPADDLTDDCCQLCGLDVQDIRATQSTYFAFSEDFEKVDSMPGGMRLPLRFEGDSTVVQVPGIGVPGKRGEFVEVPVHIQADRNARRATLRVQDQEVTLGEGEWSKWMEWTFELSPKYNVRAISRFHVMEAGENVRVYMTCLQYHPREPMIPISSPGAFADELADRYGLYKTIGWAYDTKALQQDDMTEEMFLQDIKQTMAWRETLALDEIDRGNFDLLVAAWTAPDRVSHLFWRFRDPKHPLYTPEGAEKYGRVVEDTYIKMDEIVGKVMDRIEENDLLMIMSDHGFHSFRYGFSVNTWLVRNGYLAVKGQTDPETAYTDDKYLLGFDWARSKAYGLGLGMIFVNQRGREGQGMVSMEEKPALLEELKEKLMSVTDPATGDKIFGNVYLTVEAKGASAIDAPDIQLGYTDGYQTDKGSAAGGMTENIFEPNLNKWSGEHASSDTASTSGIFFSNRPITAEPTLLDLGVTALKYLGATPPPSFQGKPLL